MNEFNSINEFFTQIGCRFQCYDMGRLIQSVEKQILIDFEQNNISWPTPFMQHAWIAILFWVPKSKQSTDATVLQNHYVWFLKLPLDEQAKLNLIARDDFLRRLIEALTDHLQHSIESAHDSETAKNLHTLENAMKDNPYGFQPKQEQLANFHAIVHKHLSLPASQYYQDVQSYFSRADGFEHWKELGYQGFADIAARLDEEYNGKSNQEHICNSLAQIPASPLHVLGNCLENHSISDNLLQQFIERTEQELNNDTESLVSFCVAALHASAKSQNTQLQGQLIKIILQSPVKTDIEILASISGRCWQQLIHSELLILFLDALASTEHGQGAFNAIISDLMFIPGMREPILQAFRSPERSEQVAQAIGAFFSQITR